MTSVARGLRAEFHGHERDSGIYVIRDSKTGASYIGSSIRLAKRAAEHVRGLMRGKHHNRRLLAAWQDDPARLTLEVVAVISDESEMTKIEATAIAMMRGVACYNDWIRGGTLTAATRARIGLSQRGKQKSPEHRAKIAAALRGKKRTAEQCASMSAARKGVPVHTQEHRAKVAERARGNKYALGSTHVVSERAKELISNAMKGNTHGSLRKKRDSNLGSKRSEETRQRMRDAWQRRKAHADNSRDGLLSNGGSG